METCPSCHSRAQFHEVELTESFGMFFVDLVDDKDHAFRCGACGEVFDRKDRSGSRAYDIERTPPPVLTKSPADLERDRLVAAQRRRDLEREEQLAAQRRREAAAAQANRIEDELAELKKRLGRS